MKDCQLDLSRHCILTEIRRQQERAVAQALKGQADDSLMEKAEALKEILETADLLALRGQYAELQGGASERVSLSLVEGRYCLRFSGKTIPLLPKILQEKC